MIVSYDNMTGSVINGYRLLYKSLLSEDLTFTFENYVKSQVHLPILAELYKRNKFSYLNALKYLNGNKSHVQSCVEVLKYFYEDMLRMLVQSLKENPDIDSLVLVESLIEGDDHFTVVTRDLGDVRADLEHILEDPEFETPYAAILSQFNTKELQVLKPTNVLAMAGILAQLLYVDKTPVLLEVFQ